MLWCNYEGALGRRAVTQKEWVKRAIQSFSPLLDSRFLHYYCGSVPFDSLCTVKLKEVTERVRDRSAPALTLQECPVLWFLSRTREKRWLSQSWACVANKALKAKVICVAKPIAIFRVTGHAKNSIFSYVAEFLLFSLSEHGSCLGLSRWTRALSGYHHVRGNGGAVLTRFLWEHRPWLKLERSLINSGKQTALV